MQHTETALPVGKLVRDGIPQIIRDSGAEPITYVAGPEEYRDRLRAKISEECQEVLEAGAEDVPGEVADLVEAALAYAADFGVSAEEVEEIRAAKAAERGGFAGRVIWTGNR
ncbi:nucleoside triphosphate pyrophosphohydrolase [Streptomyces roseolus]|uniref:nucleoside triphosphate pyrophosphohydrolase n=1 Tax=Streptomyces roseolus TaxID=67358 RepID=UPI00379EF7C5